MVSIEHVASTFRPNLLLQGWGMFEQTLGPPVVPFYLFFEGEGSPIKIDYRKWVPVF